MYGRILVALDGSEFAEEVLPLVEELAEKAGSTLLLVQVAPRLGTDMVAASAPQDPTLTHRFEVEAAGSYLGAVAKRLREKGRTVLTAQPEGHAAEEILAYARKEEVDLIAITTHGRGALGRLLFGSVADEVLQQAPCPVLVERVGKRESDVR
jgi:nucleotide-binding universal stress UspA family protein